MVLQIILAQSKGPIIERAFQRLPGTGETQWMRLVMRMSVVLDPLMATKSRSRFAECTPDCAGKLGSGDI